MTSSTVASITPPWERGRTLMRELIGGSVASIVLIANLVSFSALMFHGALAHGSAIAVWSMLIGSAIIGLWVSWKTSLPPLSVGIDSPTGAVLVLLAASASDTLLAAGGAAHDAIEATMLLFTAATALSGALLFGLGRARCGALLRFVPYFVIAGFLGATGALLIAGGLRIVTGRRFSALTVDWSDLDTAKLLAGLAVWLLLLTLRSKVRWPLAIPAALVAMTVACALVFKLPGLSAFSGQWYLPSLGTLEPWTPLHALRAEPMTLSTFASFVPELFAVAIVSLVSLATKTASLEVSRKVAGDLDVELRSHGIATLVAVPLGGIVCSVQLGTSRLLESIAGPTRLSGTLCAVILGIVGLSNFDLPRWIPLPIAAGLVFQLGWGFLVEAFSKLWARRDWSNMALAIGITIACVRFGYIAGVVGGVVGACLLFAASYARIGVVRQHLSRAQFSGHVSRSSAASSYLGEHGDAIQLYWLSGYLFFGSSESLFERVRSDIEALPPRRVRYVVLDFAMVPAVDASATISLTKLKNACDKHGAQLLYASLSADIRRALDRDGFFNGRHATAPFDDANTALAWAEDRLLVEAHIDTATDDAGFDAWLQRQLGSTVQVGDFLGYLERRRFAQNDVLYHQGDAADHIDLVVSGVLAVDVSIGGAPAKRLRSITTRTVVGEMGFFSRATRSATVRATETTTVLTLARASFERLQRERPDLAAAFYEFLVRTLSDRIRMSERMALALGR